MMEINFSPFPVLKSGRLTLREITSADVDAVFALRSDPDTMRYIPRPLAKNTEDALTLIGTFEEMLIKKECINWAITLSDNEKLLVGMICLIRIQPENFRTEVGYILHPDFRGKGIMLEAVNRIVKYAFADLKFHTLEAVIDPRNIASQKVLDAAGFIREGLFKDKVYYNGQFLDSAVYSMLNADES
ncbi:GNAT family N-acetyltransferase [Pedobacter antarcticus]|nr:GNAT family N-acetyltransferase [Pedobacter antarcticus]